MIIDTVSVLHLEYKVGQLLCVLRERNPDMKRTKNGTCSLDAILKGQCFFLVIVMMMHQNRVYCSRPVFDRWIPAIVL